MRYKHIGFVGASLIATFCLLSGLYYFNQGKIGIVNHFKRVTIDFMFMILENFDKCYRLFYNDISLRPFLQ